MAKFRATQLLQKIADRGYSDDYLRARLRGRRSRLVADWKPLVAAASPLAQLPGEHYRDIIRDLSTTGAGFSLALEYRWVYAQMNADLKDICGPFFLYSELRTLFICLRHLKEGQKTETKDLLSASLLSPAMKRILLESPDVQEAVSLLEDQFVPLSGDFKGLAALHAKEGLRVYEKELTERYLASAVRAAIHPSLRLLFRRLIDSRNIIGVYKWLDLRPAEAFTVVPGGTIPAARLSAIVEEDDREGLASLIRELYHAAPGTVGYDNPEAALYRGISGFLKKERRDPSGLWVILDYLWRCSVEVMNLNLLLHGKDLKRETLARVLVT